jgi:2-keto-4-pentenoate hydratase/2-oxohepta-3-ene-1,7-dioic acid hydratase in catechol pathway
MKLATFMQNNVQRIGAITNEGTMIAPLQENHRNLQQQDTPLFVDMLAFLRGGETARALAEEIVKQATLHIPLTEVALLSPVPRPESIRDFMAFERHILNCIRTVGLKKLGVVDAFVEKHLGARRSLAGRLNRVWYDQPIYYKGNRFSVVGDGAVVDRPAYTNQLDFELEWGVFICKEGRDIPKEQAAEYIGGYTIFNDFSARDMQLKEQAGRLGPAKGKDFDTGNAVGPWLVTPDEIGDRYNLAMTASVNSEQWSKGNTKEMYWTFEDMIAHASQSETLYPGEFIGAGTCSGKEGMGCGLELGRFLSPGDQVTLFVENIGSLTNTIA